MDSKETIYKRHHTYAEFDLIPNKESCLNAMDEYAKITAIDFLHWCIKTHQITLDDKWNMGTGKNDENIWAEYLNSKK